MHHLIGHSETLEQLTYNSSPGPLVFLSERRTDNPTSLSRVLDPQEETFEKQEVSLDKGGHSSY